ncbi:MAG: hypothetical protein M5U28_20165 [Sandaracinaceae bacterium]|nr:hypothetical protein [Sandaracinaceae bacterium]
MSIPAHIVRVKIAEARARGELDQPRTDEARLLRELARLLEASRLARGPEIAAVRERLRRCEDALAGVLERTGRSMLAEALWDEAPTFDA